MPTAEKTKTHKQTWLDGIPEWLQEIPIAGLYTRQEVLGALHDRGVDINEGTLVSLEKADVLPRPIRRYRDGAPRALYPPWAVDAIQYLRQLQAKGMTRAQIAPLMTAWELSRPMWEDPLSGPLTIIREELLGIARSRGIDVARFKITFHDDDGGEIWRHELGIPDEWRPTNQSRKNWGSEDTGGVIGREEDTENVIRWPLTSED